MVTFENGEVASAKLTGFALINGNGDGGGMRIINSNPTLLNIRIVNNSGSPAGIYCSNTSSPIINDVVIANNNGDGLYVVSSSPILTRVSIRDNIGTGLYITGNIGSFGIPVLTMSESNILRNSSANYGGGIRIADGSVRNCLFNNVNISENYAAQRGGGFYSSTGQTQIFTNCTFTKNIADDYGGAIYGGNNTYINCILWNNTVGGQGSNIVSQGTVSYSNIQGGWEGEGNIDEDPLFVDAANGDYRLSDYSPAIGAGTATGAPTTDIDGNPRPNPVGSSPDMGSYENALGSPLLPPAPTNLAATVGNSVVNLSWTGNDYVTSYSVYRSTTSGSGFTAIATGLSTTSYQNTGLTNETTYY